ncbi:Piso0_002001 [Millerozyma farinosa CBS 7064]|uniref:Piso0_002001 protein n=1 Tax=Pichia sorbitophila (strain ATCC MYA-4447 / BCRC 22081 / CBS 7064 / NBRC 10061 / NRRL Y-12695) TaxID=559304 RepID=G8YM97_PICSO|nr:Piso0_002001 [Millerozyma farinosa CBS 7064]
MSAVKTEMINNRLNALGQGHMRTGSYSELMSKFRASISSRMSANMHLDVDAGKRKRAFGDIVRESEDIGNHASKRPRTAPPSPHSPTHASYKTEYKSVSYPSKIGPNLRSRSLSPHKAPENTPRTEAKTKERKGSVDTQEKKQSEPVRLPSISAVLAEAESMSRVHAQYQPITPTVSLDYFDTYKPNDEQWRCGIMDTIRQNSTKFNMNQYSYLQQHAGQHPECRPRPSFDSRISSKIAQRSSADIYPPCISEKIYSKRKINFPYESNYTYLNKTYLNDVENYPEYLELARSLIHLSKPIDVTPKQPSVQQHNQIPNMEFPPLTPSSANSVTNNSMSYRQSYVTQKHTSEASYANESDPLTVTPSKQSHHNMYGPQSVTSPRETHSKPIFIPVTPPSSKSNSKSEHVHSPTKSQAPRMCISCGSEQSPCWRPSWSIKEGQLCNSCGLRYKKTSARCLNKECKKIPAKGEWSLMQSKGKTIFEDGTAEYSCLDCGFKVEVKK